MPGNQIGHQGLYSPQELALLATWGHSCHKDSAISYWKLLFFALAKFPFNRSCIFCFTQGKGEGSEHCLFYGQAFVYRNQSEVLIKPCLSPVLSIQLEQTELCFQVVQTLLDPLLSYP